MLYVATICVIFSAVLICILGVVYAILVVLKRPLRYSDGKKSAVFTIYVGVLYLRFVVFMMDIFASRVDENILEIVHPTVISFILIAVAIGQYILCKPNQAE